MDDAFKNGCDDDRQDEPCAICRGEVSDEFVAMTEKAAAQPGRAMTIDQFEAWLDGLCSGGSTGVSQGAVTVCDPGSGCTMSSTGRPT